MAVWSVVEFLEVAKSWRFDAEYWRPVHVENERLIERAGNKYGVETVSRLSENITGSAFYPSIAEYYSHTEGMPFIRVANLKGFFVDDTELIRLPPDLVEGMSQIATITEGDIVVAKGGTIGGICLLQPGIEECAVSRDVIAIRTNTSKINPAYLVAFLKSRFGQLQIDRYKSQQVQAHLTFPAIGGVKVVVPPQDEQQKVADLIWNARSRSYQSKSLYAQAEALLLHELGLEALDLSHQTTFTATFAEVMEARRLDAEYFQPKYRRVLQGIANSPYPSKALGELIEPIRNGFDYRQFTDNGTPYIRVGDIQNGRINLQGAAKVNMSVDQVRKNIQLKPGDVLFTRKGSFGNAAVVNEDCVQAIISSEIMLLRPRNQLDYLLLSDYLSLFLNSNLGYQQIERNVHGVAFYSISQPDLARVRVVILPPEKQQTLVDTLRQSSRSEQEATQLLEQAKQRVEELILEGN